MGQRTWSESGGCHEERWLTSGAPEGRSQTEGLGQEKADFAWICGGLPQPAGGPGRSCWGVVRPLHCRCTPCLPPHPPPIPHTPYPIRRWREH